MEKSARSDAASYVETLQKVVHDGPTGTRAMDELADERAGNATMRVRSDDGEDGTLRVLQPTPSLATLEIDEALPAESVHFFLTRPTDDDAVETRLLGVARYRDSKGRWTVRFDTERFGRSRDDLHVIHAEVFGPGGDLLATIAKEAIT